MKTYIDTATGKIWEFEDDVADIYAFPHTPATLEPYTRPVPTAAELQAVEDAKVTAAAKVELSAIDVRSIRAMREFILAKFTGDPALPAVLATHESDAVTERTEMNRG